MLRFFPSNLVLEIVCSLVIVNCFLARQKVYWTFLAGDRSRCQSPRTTLHGGRIIEMKGDPKKTAVGAYPAWSTFTVCELENGPVEIVD